MNFELTRYCLDAKRLIESLYFGLLECMQFPDLPNVLLSQFRLRKTITSDDKLEAPLKVLETSHATSS